MPIRNLQARRQRLRASAWVNVPRGVQNILQYQKCTETRHFRKKVLCLWTEHLSTVVSLALNKSWLGTLQPAEQCTICSARQQAITRDAVV